MVELSAVESRPRRRPRPRRKPRTCSLRQGQGQEYTKSVQNRRCSTNLCTLYQRMWLTDTTTFNTIPHKTRLYWQPGSASDVAICFDDLRAQGQGQGQGLVKYVLDDPQGLGHLLRTPSLTIVLRKLWCRIVHTARLKWSLGALCCRTSC